MKFVKTVKSFYKWSCLSWTHDGAVHTKFTTGNQSHRSMNSVQNQNTEPFKKSQWWPQKDYSIVTNHSWQYTKLQELNFYAQNNHDIASGPTVTS